MHRELNSETPLFVQIAERLENAILSDALAEERQAPSTTEISVSYKINPATALKGITLLVDEGVLYKKRGLGMFVATGAKQAILLKRKNKFGDKFVKPMIREAEKLLISREEIINMIRSGFEK
ncbi:MAG: hypothetical protein WDA65_03575 [Christensenellales bacterium]